MIRSEMVMHGAMVFSMKAMETETAMMVVRMTGDNTAYS
jgi:hypothetical protein